MSPDRQWPKGLLKASFVVMMTALAFGFTAFMIGLGLHFAGRLESADALFSISYVGLAGTIVSLLLYAYCATR